ncbi:MAG: hypothetical protein ACHQXA_02215 [Gemmatimonadales bacterium]
MRRLAGLLALAVFSACSASQGTSTSPSTTSLVAAPSGLTYLVGPVGTGTAPSGVLLEWNYDSNPNLSVWRVYSRRSLSAPFNLRAETTSPTFHDAGVPDMQYLVTALDVNGVESNPSLTVTINEALALASPESLTTTALNRGVALFWADNAFASDPNAFLHYRVYSASYDLNVQSCKTDWSLEGTTVSPEFVAGVLLNGVPRCFAVTAVDTLGYESLWSPTHPDTPRPDARDVVLYAEQAQDSFAAFRFWADTNGDGLAEDGEIGRVLNGTNLTADFSVQRDGSNNLFLTPVRAGTTVQSAGAITDLGDIHGAPVSGYGATALQALPGNGYIFQMSGGDGFERYGAVRVSHVGQTFLILDWAYQSDPGNPMLTLRPRPAPTPQPHQR